MTANCLSEASTPFVWLRFAPLDSKYFTTFSHLSQLFFHQFCLKIIIIIRCCVLWCRDRKTVFEMAACICGWTTKVFPSCRYLSKNVARYRPMLIWISNRTEKVSCRYRNIALGKAFRTHLISRQNTDFNSHVEEIQISFLPLAAQTGVRPLFQLSPSLWLPSQLRVALQDC